jgi:hypothetical protein
MSTLHPTCDRFGNTTWHILVLCFKVGKVADVIPRLVPARKEGRHVLAGR